MEHKTEETKLDETEALTVALAQERLTNAQLVLAMRQREMESVVASLRTKYETDSLQLVALDASRGVVTRRPRQPAE